MGRYASHQALDVSKQPGNYGDPRDYGKMQCKTDCATCKTFVADVELEEKKKGEKQAKTVDFRFCDGN